MSTAPAVHAREKGQKKLQLSDLTPPELLQLHAAIGEELRERGIVRSSNNPVGDFAEYLFCKAFGWNPAGGSNKGSDALCGEGKLYQIKSRRPTRHNPSRQLSAMRELDKGGFDFLAGVIFAENYTVARAAIIPHDIVLANASYVERTNSWKFYFRDSVWDWPGVKDVTGQLSAVSL